MRAVVSRWALWALAVCTVVAGCSSTGEQRADVRPRNVMDLCAIFTDNPHWRDAAKEAKDRWGTPIDVKMAIMWRESTFRSQARPVKYVAGMPVGYASTAYGFSQAIDGTWDWYVKDTGRRNADRTRFSDAIDFIGWYLNKTAEMSGISFYDAYDQYLAYHEGQNGYNRGTWRAKPQLQRAAEQVAAQAMRYRSQGQTCGGI